MSKRSGTAAASGSPLSTDSRPLVMGSSDRADALATIAAAAMALTLLISVAFVLVSLPDGSDGDTLFVIGFFVGPVSIVLAIVAISISHKMSPRHRRLAIASIVMAGIQLVASPILVGIAFASYFNNF